jgi:hypothetical protein
MWYIQGSNSKVVRTLAATHDLGLLVSPISKRTSGVRNFRAWAVDNGCFSQPDAFDLDRYLVWLAALREWQATCLFVTAPDVVGDWATTLALASGALGPIRALGYKAALVAQDGLTPDRVPWDDLDAVFTGGSTKWKLSEDACAIVMEARRRGKWCHMGRVNSQRRYDLARVAGYHSVDGNHIGFEPTKNLAKVRAWLDGAQRQMTIPIDAWR